MPRAIALLLVLLALGCSEQSRVDPKATVTVLGAFRDAAGAPLQDRPVRLGSGVSTGDGTLAYLTLGLACTSGICRGRVRDTETDARGGYRFTLKGRDTQSSFGEAESFLLTGSAAPRADQVSGAAVSARFTIQHADLQLPVLSLVDPALQVRAQGAQVAASWTTPAPGPYALTFETDSLVPVWRAQATGRMATLDPRLLEDTAGRAVLSGSATDKVVGSDLAIAWRSPGIGYAAAAGAPPSRGRSCGEGDCWLTDGDLSTPSRPVCPEGAKCPYTSSATVDLGGLVSTELVVVRGCAGGCAVDVSADGRSYRSLGSVSDEFGAVALPRAHVRYVRVGLGRNGLREVSVWGAAAGVLKNLDERASELLQEPFNPQQDEQHHWPIAIAAVLVALGLLGVGFAAGRRRSA